MGEKLKKFLKVAHIGYVVAYKGFIFLVAFMW